jgi:ABC-type transport system involved in cytochrome c biogenesis permease subunit
LLSIFSTSLWAQTPSSPQLTPERAEALFHDRAAGIDASVIRRAATQNNGRIKPFDTLARETMLFINGSYGRSQLSPVQMYLAAIVDDAAPFTPLIEVRHVPLREELGAMRDQRFFSLAELEASPLQALADPLLQKNQENSKSLSEREKKILEVYQQFQLLKAVQSGDHLLQSIDFSFLQGHGNGDEAVNADVQTAARTYLRTLAEGSDAGAAAQVLVEATRAQSVPDLLRHGMSTLELEIFYNDAHLFLWASLCSLLLGALLLMPPVVRRLSDQLVMLIYTVPVGILAAALALRVDITRFAPVTNMYTTMIWVAFGILAFSFVLFLLYRNRTVSALMLLGCGAVLMLTEKTPLVLSPDMDPIVAVLRSNYWLSTHVTTITISYAAFTIAMILGNTALIRAFFYPRDEAFVREYSHYAYRMIQLGCFLLTVGIILGGIWADYSWGRFWGWDPKETWALIADLGFLAILHARFIGWLNGFALLACCPVAYLLVIMAWYGVNFVLAAGLHSYGFSSGGTMMIVTFLTVQLMILALSFARVKLSNQKSATP